MFQNFGQNYSREGTARVIKAHTDGEFRELHAKIKSVR
jgi:hypothetical protein